MINKHHQEILRLIRAKAGKPSQHTLSDTYLGNTHPKYAIRVPDLRLLAKSWMKVNASLSAKDFEQLLTSLIEGKSSTEKCTAGILMDYAWPHQRSLAPALYLKWLNHVEGWVEVDTLCTNKFTSKSIVSQLDKWEPVIRKLARGKSLEKRRASLVLLCGAVRLDTHARLVTIGFENILLLSAEKDILITKAISWLLRTLIKHHRLAVEEFLNEHREQLPAIAVRETAQKLKTGRKSTKKL